MTSPTIERDSSAQAVARSAELEAQIAATPERFRVLTGDRPTGTRFAPQKRMSAAWCTG